MDSGHLSVTNADEVDPWAWVNEADTEAEVDLAQQQVTAVMVAHNGAEWLPAALAGLALVQPTPAQVVLVNAGSTDQTGELLAEAASQHGWLVAHSPAGSLREAVASALQHPDAIEADPHQTSWLWVLHDDAVPEPQALKELLSAALTESAAIAVPKLVQPRTRQQPARVSELGASVARSGRRHVNVDPGEIDQGQHDRVRRVLGGSTCGLLITRAVFDRLGGFHPALDGHRDGVELGWRANLAGETAIAVPQARVSHRQAGLAGLRPGSGNEAVTDRLYGMVLVAAHAHGLWRLLTPLRLIIGCVLRAVGFLLGKAPDRSAEEMRAAGRFLGAGRRIRGIRRSVHQVGATPAAVASTHQLRPKRWAGLKRVIDDLGAGWAERWSESDLGTRGTNLDELTGDDFAGVGNRTRPWQSAYLITTVVVLLAAAIAGRSLWGSGKVVGPALLGSAASLSDAFTQWLAPLAGAWQGPPWLGVQAVLSTLTFGQPEWASRLVIVGMVPLAMIAVFPLVRRLLVDRRVRVWAGLAYGLLPALLGGSTQGRLALGIAAIVLPLLFVMVLRTVRALTDPDTEDSSWRPAWAAGIFLTVLVSVEPLSAPVAILAAVAGVIVMAIRRGAAGALAARLSIMIGVPAVALVPWWPALMRYPQWLLLGPDSALAGTVELLPTSGIATPPWLGALLLGRAGGPGFPPWWVSAVVIGALWLTAVVGTLLRPRAMVVRLAWGGVIGGLMVATALSKVVLPAIPMGPEVRPWVGVWLLVAFGSLVVAAATGIDELVASLVERDFSWVQPVTALSLVLLALTTVLGAGWWVFAGGSGPSTTARTAALPSFVSAELAAQPGQRALSIDATTITGSADPSKTPVGYLLVDGKGVQLGDADRGFATGGDSTVDAQASQLSSRLVAASGDETVAEDLRALGIRYVVVRGPAEVITGVNNTPGLRVVSVAAEERIWEVTGELTVSAVAAPVPTTSVFFAVGQGIWLLVAIFIAAPRLRRQRSKDPAQRARHGWHGARTPAQQAGGTA